MMILSSLSMGIIPSERRDGIVRKQSCQPSQIFQDPSHILSLSAVSVRYRRYCKSAPIINLARQPFTLFLIGDGNK